MKKIKILLASFFAAGMMFAAPADPTLKKFVQPDGTTISVYLCGDENFAYYQTEDGVTLMRDAQGAFYVAHMDQGALRISGVLAHDADNRSVAEQNFIQTHSQLTRDFALNTLRTRQQARAERRAAENKRRAAARRAADKPEVFREGVAPGTYEGDKKGIVILVEFPDQKFQADHTREVYDDMMNKEDYDSGRGENYGSVSKYFREQSYNKLHVDFDVVGPYMMPNPVSYYGNDLDFGGGAVLLDPSAIEMVIEAIDQADRNGVDFSKYDWDSNGEVDQVVIIYSGIGQNDNGAPDWVIWPHEDSFISCQKTPPVYDGVKINCYACSSELANYGEPHIDGIGIICHEFSHCLGLPDLYDTAQGTQYGPFTWSLMNQGCYNTLTSISADNPTGYMAYERMYAGWLNPTVLDEPTDITDMQPLTEKPEAYIIYNDRFKNEYYLLENRQLVGADKSNYGHGLLVSHVDYKKEVWDLNAVNDELDHPRMQIIAADNEYRRQKRDRNLIAGDTYPGYTGNTELTDESVPAATLFNYNNDGRKFMGKPITHISENDKGLVSFLFNGGVPLETPTALAAEPKDNAFTATWNGSEDTETFDVELFAGEVVLTTDNVILTEDMSKCKGNGEGGDSGSRVEVSTDSFFHGTGWTPENMYSGIGRMRFGNGSKKGSLISPALCQETLPELTVYFKTEAYNDKTTDVEVRLLDAEGNTLQSESLVLGDNQCVFNYNSVPAGAKFGIYAAGRVYIKDVAFWAGNLNFEDITATASPLQTVTATTPVYTFESLDNAVYKVRVRANNSLKQSPWCQSLRVPVGVVDGISTITTKADGKIFGIDGRQATKAAESGIYVRDNKKVIIK